MTVPTGPELKGRITAIYVALEKPRSPQRGALTWFARKAKVHPQTVSGWVNNRYEIQGTALALLKELERSAAAVNLLTDSSI